MQHLFIPKITRTNTQITGIGIFTITVHSVRCTLYTVQCTVFSWGQGVQYSVGDRVYSSQLGTGCIQG